MDCNIVPVAPERARSAEIRPTETTDLPIVLMARACHTWLSANDDLNTYRFCGALFCIALLVVLWGHANG